MEQILARSQSTLVTRCCLEPDQILSRCHLLVPCVVVVDDELIEKFDFGALSKGLFSNPSIHVLVETAEASAERAEHLLRLGCVGMIHKTASTAQARRAIRVILDGEFWVGRKAVAGALRTLLREARFRLTVREAEILALVARGLKNSQIANQLCISPLTVRWHLRSIYGKIGTHDRASAAASKAVPAKQAAGSD
ncbi:MAG: response regulator transcription factor [Acidobacteria bacterium]|nr:response regulator transcription factor [Acidobacteriota bacterium]